MCWRERWVLGDEGGEQADMDGDVHGDVRALAAAKDHVRGSGPATAVGVCLDIWGSCYLQGP